MVAGIRTRRLLGCRAARSARSRIERDDRRKTRTGTGMAGLARDEDTEFSASAPARSGTAWVVVAAIGAVVAVGGILTALLLTGVI